MVKPSTGSGLESPNCTHIGREVLTVAVVGNPKEEVEAPRVVVGDLRTTPIEAISKTANGNSVYKQLV